MKKLFFLALLLVSSLTAMAEGDYVTAKVATSTDLKESTVSVYLTNDIEYVAFQMDIVFPTTMDLTAADPVLTSRLSDSDNQLSFGIVYNMINPYTLRVVAYNMKNSSIGGNSGDCLFTVTLNENADAAVASSASEWTPSLSKVLFVKSDEGLSEVELTENSNVVDGFIAGDIVPDGEIDVNDIVGLIAIIYQKDTTGLNVDAADVNNDSSYDVNDIVGLISLIYK